jgi:hypothetical protein
MERLDVMKDGHEVGWKWLVFNYRADWDFVKKLWFGLEVNRFCKKFELSLDSEKILRTEISENARRVGK